ncbi:deoxycytidine triphosphate deaminase [Pyrolobus fumarii 1A]|uniref:dCTP deaminase n=1 Tax=Pyrolobus fumarii (strain DSM 11204 / 1A) TaxID=694429 RepID=G0EH32_PYRF1|nr:dCTP deaminase [Pyrolobus fumarii]AEM38482.1 deoxycytidine triphosphate deaminase [Pyrolobus fumarii 1A]
MILSDRDILHLVELKRLVIEPFEPSIVRENGVDLRLGNIFCRMRRTLTRILDTKNPPSDIDEWYRCEEVDPDHGFVIYPHEHVLAHTLEWIELPDDVVGLVNVRSTFARFGLYIPPTVVDAGFKGQLVIELIGSEFPVRVYPGQRFLHLVFVKTTSPVAKPYHGKYQGQKGVTLPRPDPA